MNNEPLSNRFDTNNEIYQKLYPIISDHDVIIAGGAARQAYFNTDFGSTDIDCYFSYDYNMKEFRKSIKRLFPVRSKWSDYALTLECKDFPTIQFIKGISVKSIFDTYDFYCCQFAIYRDTLYYTNNAIEDATNRILRYTGYAQQHPLSLTSVFHPKGHRLIKYVFHKGYTIGDDICQKAFDDYIISFLKRETTSSGEIAAFMKGEPWSPKPIYAEVGDLGNLPIGMPALNFQRVQQFVGLMQQLPADVHNILDEPNIMANIAQREDEGDF